MDQALQELKEIFFQQMGSVALFDANGKYVAVNEGWQNRYTSNGKALIELEGHDVREFVPNSLVHDVLRTRKPISGMSFWTETGTSAFLVANYIPLFKDGELIGVGMYSIFTNSEEARKFYHEMKKVRLQLEYYQNEVNQLQQTKYTIENIIGNGRAIQKLKAQIVKAGGTASVVLIEGETGSGKELVAQAIHNLSARSDKPFVRLNCTTIPPNLAEAELFGYEGGSFTGASKAGKIGKFEAAKGGSIFLDEINSLPLDIQPKLLRVLQEREIEHVGSSRSICVDVRVIAATNVPLRSLIDSGEFRRDLFYRLNVLSIKVPSLRERMEDLPLLTTSLINSLNSSLGTEIEQISDEALKLLSLYDWPGNVRELRNVIERAMIWKTKGVLWPEDFSGYFTSHSDIPLTGYIGAKDALVPLFQMDYSTASESFEKQYLMEALVRWQGNKKLTAEHIGLSRAMFYRKLEKYGLK